MQFGERWATMWLDLARYSDIFGFEKDIGRTIWPWRDWVIQAFNSNLPYDQFTIKQLAGDLLPDATVEDIWATAFHRNTQNNTEGGTDDEEFRMAAVVDRVNTLWTTWQGTTFGCVRCHAHPYDPYPQSDYYRFAAFFNTAEDCDQNDDYPTYLIAQDAAELELSGKLQADTRQLRLQINDSAKATAAKLDDTWTHAIPSQLGSTGGQLQVDSNGLVTAQGTLPIGVKYTITVPGQVGATALRLSILPESSDPAHPPERGSVLTKLTINRVDGEGMRTELKLSDVVADYLSSPHDPLNMLMYSHGGFGSYPVMWDARWCVFVLDQPVSEGTVALELSMEQAVPSNSGFQACPLRRFIQLYDWGWDSHGASESEALNGGFLSKVKSIDRPITALLQDLRKRGLLDDTLVIWSGEFGRTSMRENRAGLEMKWVGRDHNPLAFTVWMAGGGVKPGLAYGETDELGYQAVIDPVSVHGLHATILQLLGFDHLRFYFPSQGVNQRFSNVTKPDTRVIRQLIA